MDATRTTTAIQRYLDELRAHPEDSVAPKLVHELLGRTATRLHLLCSSMIRRRYPRLARPPLNLRGEEMLGAVVERLIKAMKEARPGSVREFFGLANQHMRWELNDLARRLDEHPVPLQFEDQFAAHTATSASHFSTEARRVLAALESLGEEEREVFGLVRIQGLTHSEASEVLGVSTKTVQRRLNRSRVQLVILLKDFAPDGENTASDLSDN